MTDKQINIVEILAEQCKNCTLYEGDTVSLNISIFDRQLKGVCFNNNIYFSVDELNYIMQKLISKEQECDVLRKLAETHLAETINMQRELDQLTEELAISIQENEEGREINAELKADNEHLSEKEKEARHYLEEAYKFKQALTEIKEIAEHCVKQDICTTCDNSDKCHIEDEEIPTYDVCKLILQKIKEVIDEN